MPEARGSRLRPDLLLAAAAALVFIALAVGVHGGTAFAFDEPVLRHLHAVAGPGLDRTAWWVARLGYGWGVLPFDALLVLGLAMRRARRDALFAGVTLAVSLGLNTFLKHVFERARPAYWLPAEVQHTWSFPSGHAMADATLAVVLVALVWSTRWRVPVCVASALFVLLVGLDRVYLGVHFPSDVLGGWAAGVAWACAMHAVLRRPPAG